MARRSARLASLTKVRTGPRPLRAEQTDCRRLSRRHHHHARADQHHLRCRHLSRPPKPRPYPLSPSTTMPSWRTSPNTPPPSLPMAPIPPNTSSRRQSEDLKPPAAHRPSSRPCRRCILAESTPPWLRHHPACDSGSPTSGRPQIATTLSRPQSRPPPLVLRHLHRHLPSASREPQLLI